MPGPKHAKAHLPPRAISKKTTGLALAIVRLDADVMKREVCIWIDLLSEGVSGRYGAV